MDSRQVVTNLRSQPENETRTDSHSDWARSGHEIASEIVTAGNSCHLNWFFPVVGTGVDPVTSRFSGVAERHLAEAVHRNEPCY